MGQVALGIAGFFLWSSAEASEFMWNAIRDFLFSAVFWGDKQPHQAELIWAYDSLARSVPDKVEDF